MNQDKWSHSGLPFGWIEVHGVSECVPTTGFDFAKVFKRLDGDELEKESEHSLHHLSEVLSPRELQHAFAIAQAILKRSSPYSKATRAAWRDPVSRQKRMAGLLRAAKNPEVRRKRSESLRRFWQGRDRQQKREFASKLWRERRPELIAKLKIAVQKPEYRKRASETSRARWADPTFRQRILSLLRSPEARRRASVGTQRYFQLHPEARQRAADLARTMWRNPAFRSKRNQTIAARKLAAAAQSQPCHTQASGFEQSTTG